MWEGIELLCRANASAEEGDQLGEWDDTEMSPCTNTTGAPRGEEDPSGSVWDRTAQGTCES
jgi:hypothetical protein